MTNQAANYQGPDFYTAKAIDEQNWAVDSHLTGERLGIYPSQRLAEKVAKNADKLAMRNYLKTTK
jgi:hypothetical protein